MQKTILVFIFISFAFGAFAQDSKFSLEASYPVTIDNNFIGDNYSGVVDIGFGYRIIDLKPVKLGVSVNAGYLVSNNNDLEIGFENIDATSYLFQPRIFGELNLEEFSHFVPKIGIGYTSMRVSVTDPNNIEITNTTETFDGINLNLGLAYNFSRKLYAQLQYDFTQFSQNSNTPNNSYNNNLNLLKIGLGMRF